MAVTRAARRRSNSPLTPGLSSKASSRRTSPTKSNGSPSDGEGRILRPTRKQLAKTTITAADEGTASATTVTEDHDSKKAAAESGESSTAAANGTRGRGLRRKRSHEELGEEQEQGKTAEVAAKHLRKRSKDVKGRAKRDESTSVASSEEDEAAHSGDEDTAIMTSPTMVDPVAPAEDEPEVTHSGVDDATIMPSPAKGEPAAPAEDQPVASEEDRPVAQEENLSVAPEEDRPVTPAPMNEDSPQPVIDVKKSPPGKRNRDQFTEDHATPENKEVEETEVDTATELTTSATRPPLAPKAMDKGPDSKRHRDSFTGPSVIEEKADPIAKIPTSSGFANFAAQSPFAALAQPKSPLTKTETSSSAFASSGFAAMAGSSKSPFGALSPSQKSKDTLSTSGFGSIAPASGFAALGTTAKSSFASSTPSVFGGAQSSGFGSLSNGFGSGSGFGGPLNKPLSSFAASGTPSVIGAGSKPAKPFGVLGDDDDEGDASDGEDETDAKAVGADDEHRDDRFYEQDVETGEEDERTEFKSRGKLYMMGTDKQWKERGTGDFKVNSKKSDDKITARFLMRVDGSHRVVLNSPIKKDLLVEDPQRGPPRGRTAVFLGFVDGQIVTLQLKMRDNVQTLTLHDAVKKLQKEM